MRVCFSVGPMSQKLISSISKSADNVEFSSYDSIADMIKESTMRHIFFDRIVFSEKILKSSETELRALNEYISEFSDNTKIVFICQGKNSDNPKIFSSLFESPLYTVVLVDKVTTNILLEFIKGDITELKAKYYSLDIKETKIMTSKYSNGGTTSSEIKDNKQEKKGFFKSFFGGKKNIAPKIENQNPSEDTLSSEGNTQESVSKNYTEDGIKSSVADGAIAGVLGAGAYVVKNETEAISTLSESVSGSVGGSDFNVDNSYFGLDDEFLGIGDLGEQHIDTGFLDDDAENEIEEELKKLESNEIKDNTYDEEVTPILEKYSKDLESTSNVNLSSLSDDSLSSRGSNESPKYRLVIGERGVGSTSYIVDYSVNQTNKGKKVLIVDLDTIDNGILSYINSNDFYIKGKDNGIDKLSVFTEDGVDILSNGYGKSVSNESLLILLNSGLLDRYDIVFIDCPIDCIGNLNKELVSKSLSMIKVGGNRGSLLSLLSKLTNRSYISPDVEDLLFSNSKFDIVNKIDYYLEDVSFLRSLCFFGRGDWLSKIS